QSRAISNCKLRMDVGNAKNVRHLILEGIIIVPLVLTPFQNRVMFNEWLNKTESPFRVCCRTSDPTFSKPNLSHNSPVTSVSASVCVEPKLLAKIREVSRREWLQVVCGLRWEVLHRHRKVTCVLADSILFLDDAASGILVDVAKPVRELLARRRIEK